jgi:hypothetical protein
MAEKKNHEGGKLDLGKKTQTAKGAHGGGTKYHQMEVKYPKFMFGDGFKKKTK